MAYEEEDAGAIELRKAPFRDKYKNITSVKELATHMKEARGRKEAADEAKKVADAEYDVLRIEMVPARMEEQGVEKVTYEGIGRIQLTGDLYVSVKKGQKDGLFSWLKARKLGSLIQPGVNSSTLKAFIKERIEKGKEIPSEQLNVTPYTRASIVKA